MNEYSNILIKRYDFKEKFLKEKNFLKEKKFVSKTKYFSILHQNKFKQYIRKTFRILMYKKL